MIGLPHSTACCHILVKPSARLGSDKYQFLSHYFNSTSIRAQEVQIPRSPKTTDGRSTHSAIPSGTLHEFFIIIDCECSYFLQIGWRVVKTYMKACGYIMMNVVVWSHLLYMFFQVTSLSSSPVCPSPTRSILETLFPHNMFKE